MHIYFTNHGQVIPTKKLSSLNVSIAIMLPASKVFFKSLLGEERPNNMLMLLSILVVLLHIWLFQWLQRPLDEPITPAKPLLMEVSMISISEPKPSLAPQPPPQPLKLPQPPKPMTKQVVKPIPKKVTPAIQKSEDFIPKEQPVEQTNATSVAATTQAVSTSDSKAAITPVAEAFTEANFRANYASNPKPDYPAIAKSRDWQGKVLLRVQVSAEGHSDSVKVEKTSGYEILDESAIEAVKKWLFIPAKRGNTPVASSVIVPISFNLTD